MKIVLSMLVAGVQAFAVLAAGMVEQLPAGDVVLSATWRVGPESSGKTFRGAADGSTRVSAGVRIAGWTDRGDGVWGAKLPKGADGKPLFAECLFVNGRRRKKSARHQ